MKRSIRFRGDRTETIDLRVERSFIAVVHGGGSPELSLSVDGHVGDRALARTEVRRVDLLAFQAVGSESETVLRESAPKNRTLPVVIAPATKKDRLTSVLVLTRCQAFDFLTKVGQHMAFPGLPTFAIDREFEQASFVLAEGRAFHGQIVASTLPRCDSFQVSGASRLAPVDVEVLGLAGAVIDQQNSLGVVFQLGIFNSDGTLPREGGKPADIGEIVGFPARNEAILRLRGAICRGLGANRSTVLGVQPEYSMILDLQRAYRTTQTLQTCEHCRVGAEAARVRDTDGCVSLRYFRFAPAGKAPLPHEKVRVVAPSRSRLLPISTCDCRPRPPTSNSYGSTHPSMWKRSRPGNWIDGLNGASASPTARLCWSGVAVRWGPLWPPEGVRSETEWRSI